MNFSLATCQNSYIMANSANCGDCDTPSNARVNSQAASAHACPIDLTRPGALRSVKCWSPERGKYWMRGLDVAMRLLEYLKIDARSRKPHQARLTALSSSPYQSIPNSNKPLFPTEAASSCLPGRFQVNIHMTIIEPGIPNTLLKAENMLLFPRLVSSPFQTITK